MDQLLKDRKKQPNVADFLIIGGGIIGLHIARFLKKSFSDAKIILIEKENSCGLHASGRNSGVLHAGFYYTEDSLKSKFTRVGNQKLTEYCEEKKIPIKKCGKLVVTKNENDLILLDELLRRGKKNGVLLHEITESEANQLEPCVKTYKRAIFSPTTSSVDPIEIITALVKDIQNEKIEIHCGVKYLKRKKSDVVATSAGDYHVGYVINAAGLYADKIAMHYGFSKNYPIFPF